MKSKPMMIEAEDELCDEVVREAVGKLTDGRADSLAYRNMARAFVSFKRALKAQAIKSVAVKRQQQSEEG